MPSIGFPVGLTILPISESPTGTDAIRPVVFTVIPSLICVYSPKITTPTLFSSRLSVIPKVPFPSSNSTSSFDITLRKPYILAIPSPTSRTLPIFETSAFAS